MPTTPTLDDLHQHCAELAARPRIVLSTDQRLTVHFYQTEIAYRQDPERFRDAHDRTITWIRNLLALEAFVSGEGRWPTQNNRAPQAGRDTEARLSRWVSDHRKSVRAGRSCSYQIERPRCIPGYHLHPADEAWDAQLTAYLHFVTINRRLPSAAGDDADERRSAAWTAKQRHRYHAGQLLDRRRQILAAQQMWTWGRPNGPNGHPSSVAKETGGD